GVTGIITHDVSNKIFTFTPSSPLAINTLYTVTITSGAQDTFGNPLATDFVWSFRTAANGCNPPPTVVSVTPPNGATGVCPNRIEIGRASCRESLDTIDTTTFIETPGVTGNITHDVSHTTFTCTP